MPSDNTLSTTIDSLLQEAYPPSEPGVAVIATRGGETIFRNAYGMANLELGVLLEADMVFRLASIIKQFTAVAVLMLMEQGKLALDDPLTKFLPSYPTHDHVITVEHLLTHTSGIRSYTNMPEWAPLWRKDFTLQELVTFFSTSRCSLRQGSGGRTTIRPTFCSVPLSNSYRGRAMSSSFSKTSLTP